MRPTSSGETVEDGQLATQPSDEPTPGLVLVYSGVGPTMRAAPLGSSAASVELGRGSFAGGLLDDDRMSRHHAKVTYDGNEWVITDLDSRNGTFVDGERIEKRVSFDSPRVVRVGRSLFLPVSDVRRFASGKMERRGDAICGPTLSEAWSKIERAAQYGDALLLTGESGVGKEVAARAFHAAGPRAAGPFVAVNCAAIPEGLAERLLFGTRRGAYSGATTDAEGYVQAADHGTLFLDEVAELDPSIQAKLLRVLESKEVLSLGASRPRTVDIRVCSATHDLRAAVSSGRFREDLYFRIGRPEVRLPPLRERLEEVPSLVASALAKVDRSLSAHVTLIEACMLREWPGNLRELIGEMRRAAQDALAAGRTSVEAIDLGPTAGVGFVRSSGNDASARESGKERVHRPPPDRETIERTLKEQGGNVTRTARVLGLHRNQLRRWIAKHGWPEDVPMPSSPSKQLRGETDGAIANEGQPGEPGHDDE